MFYVSKIKFGVTYSWIKSEVESIRVRDTRKVPHQHDDEIEVETIKERLRLEGKHHTLEYYYYYVLFSLSLYFQLYQKVT